jgi:hypothetical protein
MANTLNQYSMSLGGPLATLNRLAMNAMKVDQTVERVLKEIEAGRKPVITFHSTNEALIKEIIKASGGMPTDAVMEEFANLSFKDQITRLHDTIYSVKIEGERQDARDTYPDIAQFSEQIRDMIDALPEDLSAFPVDDLIEKLEANDLRVGEISGRIYCYRNGEIRKREDRDRKAVIDNFNQGDLDIVIYNKAGATGGSMHSSLTFQDQRQRVLVEMEAPLQIDKYVQSHGRIDRLNQRHKPRVVTVMTGLIPEMRIIQQRNAKLRRFGATVEGNRSNPMLLENVPDLLNTVGDEATAMVLISMPALARRLGFPEYAKEDALIQMQRNDDQDVGSGAARTGLDSLASKVLARSMSLTAAGQSDLNNRIIAEYEALIEELNSRNANPLEPRRLEGLVEIKATNLFSGQERDDADLETSVFLSPLYVSTGIHHFTEEGWDAEKLVSAVEETRRLYGTDGFAPYAQRIEQNLPVILRSYVPEGLTIDEALANPVEAGGRFAYNYNRMTDLAWLLENMKPGVMMRVPMHNDMDAEIRHTIIGLIPPKDKSMYDHAAAYKIKTIAPGMSKPQIVSLSRIMRAKTEKIRFGVGISEAFNDAYLEEFTREAMIAKRMPAQILHGNTLDAITTARNNKLGTISLYRDHRGVVHRGIVVTDSQKDMSLLPVRLNNAAIASEMAYRFLRQEIGENLKVMTFYGHLDPEKEITGRNESSLIVRITQSQAIFDIDPIKRGNYDDYAARPGLYEALHENPMPARGDVPSNAHRRGIDHKYLVKIPRDSEENLERITQAIRSLGVCGLAMDGKFRQDVLRVTTEYNRMLDLAKSQPERDIQNVEDSDQPEMG